MHISNGQINVSPFQFGSRDAYKAEKPLKRNVAFLAGGSVDQEAKDAFFHALMTAYVTCRNEASATFTPKSKRKPED